MLRIDLLNFSQFGKVSDIENLLSSNPIDKPSLSAALFKCFEAEYFTQGHIESIKLLLHYGADANSKNDKFLSFFMLACCKGSLELIKILLAHGANAKDVDRQQRTSIMMALSVQGQDPVDIVMLLHENGANIFARDMKNDTALHYAAMNGHKDSIEYLLYCKADVNALGNHLDTPLHLAFRYDRKLCITALIQTADKSLKNDQGKLAIDEAHGKSLALLNSKKYPKDDSWDARRARGNARLRGKNFKRKYEKEAGECFKCKQVTEVFCLECATGFADLHEKNQESEKKRIGEVEECLRLAKMREKELEKENSELKEVLNTKTSSYNVKIKKSVLHLKHANKEKTHEQLRDQMQADLVAFESEQRRWAGKVEQYYSEAVAFFKSLINEAFNDCTVEIFGSYSTGLLLPYSDIDLVVLNVTAPTLQVLKELSIKIDTTTNVRKSDKIFTATIPVLKAYTEFRSQEVKLDITVHEPKHKGLECSILVKKFLAMYKTIKVVYLVLKQLMFFSNFHEPYKGGISSYGLFLLLVFFYQENANDWSVINSEKTKCEAEILVKFFEFYGSVFQYNKYVVVDYEGWDNREFKTKHVRGIKAHQSLYVPDPLNPGNNVVHNLRFEKFIVMNI